MARHPRLAAAALLAAALAAVPAPRPALAIDDVVYNPNNGHYYKWIAVPGTWDMARLGSEALGGYLASVTSSTERDWILSNLTLSSTGCWLGGTDAAQEGVWVWLSGEPWSWSNWNLAVPEPNNSGGEHVLMMYSSGLWNDANYIYTLPGYIVEWDVNPNAPPPPSLPAAPSGLVASLTTGGTVDLDWTDNSDNESSFEIQRRAGLGSWTAIPGANANVTTAEDGTVAILTVYTYRVRAVNLVGASAWSNEAPVLTGAFSASPAAPANLQVTDVSPGTADLQWTDQSQGEIGFELFRRTGTGPWTFLLRTLPDAVAFHDTGLAPDVDYSWQVRSLGLQKASGYAEASARTDPTLVLTTTRADLKDVEAFAKDAVKFTTGYAFVPGDSDGLLEPAATGLTLRVGDPASPLSIAVPPLAEGWKLKGTKWTYKSPKDSTVKFTITFDTGKAILTAALTKVHLPAPVEGDVRVSLVLGNDAGTETREWPATPKPGVLRLR